MIQGTTRGRLGSTRTILGVLAAGVLLAMLAGATPALAAAPWWRLSSRAAPTYLQPGRKNQQIRVYATNIGDAPANGAVSPITITDHLPQGLKATGITGNAGAGAEPHGLTCLPLPALACTFAHPVAPYVVVTVIITVELEGATSGEENKVQVQGGEAAFASLSKPITISSAETPFGVENNDYELTPEEELGSPDRQAGSHPFQLTTTLDLNQTFVVDPNSNLTVPAAPALVKDLSFKLPPGLIGNTTAVPKCSDRDFSTFLTNSRNLCRPNTAVGVAVVIIHEPKFFREVAEAVPVFNLVPAPGEPARFGFVFVGVPVALDTSVDTGGDYGVTVSVKNAPQTADLLGSRVTIWGVPGDPRHDQSRGWQCLGNGHFLEGVEPPEPCTPLGQSHPPAYLTLPTVCGPLESTVDGESWPTARAAGEPLSQLFIPRTRSSSGVSLEGCNQLPFSPSISVQPDQHASSTPSGFKVEVKVPQETTLAATGLAESDIKDTTVALPEGVQASPGAADGLLACSTESAGFKGGGGGSVERLEIELEEQQFSPGAVTCPDAAKIGTVDIKSPLLANELEGAVYLASQDTNPFQSPLVLYLIAEDPVSGVRVKLAGEVRINPETGQLISTFRNSPPVPFETLKLQLSDGPRASQTTPPLCGSYTTTSSFTPWSGGPSATPSSSFQITSGPNGAACSPNPQSFAPSFQAGSTNNQAGGFTPFTLTIGNPDGDQALQGLTMKLPDGMAAVLSSVTPCPEPQAARNECGPESLIGHSTANSGLGADPFALPGSVYLTGSYRGAPFGISVVTPAVAGPFNLGNVTVRSTINVDPSTAAVTITSDPFPTFVKGIPTHLKQVNVTVDRPGFQFNPTNCNPMTVSGTLTGVQGASAPASSPFQVANCASLPFGPKLTSEAGGHGSKANGVGLNVKLESAGLGQANIAKVELQLPVQLPSRLTTIQKACTDAVFNLNPASCDEGSVIGKAIVHTPVLKNPLIGPAYLVSHGNAAFPDVEFVLQGEGITLVLDGKTDIKKGITYSRFESTPDAPFTTFQTELPAGPHSVLGVNLPVSRNNNLCGTSLLMPTKITGQNGAVIKQTTHIRVTGCAKLTRAQLLAKALKACKKQPKRKRAACRRQARKKYGAKASGKKRAPSKKK
jgi:hypothetical protein